MNELDEIMKEIESLKKDSFDILKELNYNGDNESISEIKNTRVVNNKISDNLLDNNFELNYKSDYSTSNKREESGNSLEIENEVQNLKSVLNKLLRSELINILLLKQLLVIVKNANKGNNEKKEEYILLKNLMNKLVDIDFSEFKELKKIIELEKQEKDELKREIKELKDQMRIIYEQIKILNNTNNEKYTNTLNLLNEIIEEIKELIIYLKNMKKESEIKEKVDFIEKQIYLIVDELNKLKKDNTF